MHSHTPLYAQAYAYNSMYACGYICNVYLLTGYAHKILSHTYVYVRMHVLINLATQLRLSVKRFGIAYDYLIVWPQLHGKDTRNLFIGMFKKIFSVIT